MANEDITFCANTGCADMSCNKVRQTDYTGKCGTCSRFERDGDKRSGWCHAKPFGADVVCDPKNPYPMYPMSRIKCTMYAPAKMEV